MKKKLLIITGCILVACNMVYAQNNNSNRGKIGLTFSTLGSSTVSSGNLLSDYGYNGDHFYTMGLSYSHPLGNRFEIETGVEYSKQTIRVDIVNPRLNNPSYKSDFSLVEIPATLRFNFLNYFFANGGFLVDISASKSSQMGNQSGIGEMFGVGAKYNISRGISIFANPYMKFHSNISFSSRENHRSLTESGFRFGVAYSL